MAIHMDLQAELKALREENARLKANKGNTGGIKVSAKGAVSVYGMGRFPVTLYRSQWEALLDKAPDIRAFIKANASKLKTKDGADDVADEDEEEGDDE